MTEAETAVVEAGGDDVIQKYSGDNVRASWPFSTDTLRKNMNHYEPGAKEALIGAFLWCTKNGMRKEEFAQAL